MSRALLAGQALEDASTGMLRFGGAPCINFELKCRPQSSPVRDDLCRVPPVLSYPRGDHVPTSGRLPIWNARVF